MADTYTKEPWVDPNQARPVAAPQIRDSDLEVKEYETFVKPKAVVGRPDTSEAPAAPAAEEPKAPEETVKLAPQVTALARREAKFRQQEAALKAREAKVARLEALEEKLKAKDYSALDEVVPYDEFTNYHLDKLKGQDPTTEAIKKLAAKVESMEKSSKDNLTQQFEAAVKERRDAVTKLVEADPEYSTIKELKRHDAVVQHILDTWEHDEVDLSVEQAAKEVEEALLEEAKIYASVPKIKPAAPVEGDKKALPPLKPSVKTITNQMTASDVKTPLKPLQFLSETERYAEARRRALERLEAQKASKAA